MKSIDTSSSLRVAVLMEMLEDVSRASDPEAAFRAYADRLRRVRPVDAIVRVHCSGLDAGRYRVVRTLRLDSAGAAPVDARVPLHEWADAPVHSGGFIGSIIGRREPLLLHDLDLTSDPVLGGALTGMRSCMGVPMFNSGSVAGWSLLFHADARGYAIADLEDALLIGNLMGSMIQNLSSLERISALNTELRGQFEAVARVQRALLPVAAPVVDGLSFAMSYRTSAGAGGDCYEFFDLGQGRVGVLVADVSGHGPAAATVMAMLHAILHARPDVCARPASALKFANARLAAASVEGSHVTAVFALIDVKARRLTVARAGHPLPRTRKADKTVSEIDCYGAIPMGITTENYQPLDSVIDLEPGQSIVLYTDGISEAGNEQGEQFGLEALDRAIAGAPGDPQSIVEAIGAALARHVDGAAQTDDQTLVVVRLDA